MGMAGLGTRHLLMADDGEHVYCTAPGRGKRHGAGAAGVPRQLDGGGARPHALVRGRRQAPPAAAEDMVRLPLLVMSSQYIQ